MKYRKFIPTAITLMVFFVSVFANASYVIEVEGMGIGTVAENAKPTAADFEFATHDYSIESSDAIQIALTNLSSAVALRGNLLLWSHLAVGHPALAATDPVDISLQIQADTVAGAIEDYSYYDESADNAQDPSGVDGDTVDPDERGSALRGVLASARFDPLTDRIDRGRCGGRTVSVPRPLQLQLQPHLGG